MTASATTSFDSALSRIAGIEGWLTDDQARMLYESAREVPAGGQLVEIGSFHGRSAIVLALAAGPDARVVAIDPHMGSDRGPGEIEENLGEGEGDNRAFRENLERAGVSETVRHVRLPSADAHGDVEGELDLLYVDGAHRYAPARDDIADWGARVRDGGTMLIHDSFSSIGVTLAILRLLTFRGQFRYEGRAGSLARYRRTRLLGRTRARNAVRQLSELPWFVRNVLVKVAIVTGLKPLARLLGHRSQVFPY